MKDVRDRQKSLGIDADVKFAAEPEPVKKIVHFSDNVKFFTYHEKEQTVHFSDNVKIVTFHENNPKKLSLNSD